MEQCKPAALAPSEDRNEAARSSRFIGCPFVRLPVFGCISRRDRQIDETGVMRGSAADYDHTVETSSIGSCTMTDVRARTRDRRAVFHAILHGVLPEGGCARK